MSREIGKVAAKTPRKIKRATKITRQAVIASEQSERGNPVFKSPKTLNSNLNYHSDTRLPRLASEPRNDGNRFKFEPHSSLRASETSAAISTFNNKNA